MWSYDEVFEASKEYFNGNELSAKVFVDKYALRNDNKYFELTPNDMHRRIAKELAKIENKKFKKPLSEDEIFDYLKFYERLIPQGSILAGCGNPYQIMSLANCFVVGTDEGVGGYDSYQGIHLLDSYISAISCRRGGIGFDISFLRPAGMSVKNAANSTTGAVSFMNRFSNTGREVAQGGRRAALMCTISVHHPEVVEFAQIKKDLQKITGANISVKVTNEFLEAVENNSDYEQRFPVDSKTPVFSRMVNARQVWDQIIECAHSVAEPGILFWDNILNESPAACYDQYRELSTNPCTIGGTKVLVADGRGHVEIQQLAKEGKDVDVFCFNDDGEIAISKMRNPRITGYNQDIYRVTLENGHAIDVTKNHKFKLLDNSYKETQYLNPGDSLSIVSVYDSEQKEDNIYRYRVLGHLSENHLEHRLIAKNKFGNIPNNTHVHHIDGNPKNNSPSNLELIDGKKHLKFHSSCGNNGNAKEATNEEIRTFALELTKSLGRRFSKNEWNELAKKNNIPVEFTSYRKSELGSIIELAKWAAIECRIDHIDEDPRVVRSYHSMLEQGYEAEIIDGAVLVKRKCETCSDSFKIDFNRREVSFCSMKCSSIYIANNYKKEHTEGLNKYYKEKQVIQKQTQASIFNDLKFKLNRKPLLKEFAFECKNKGVPFRFKTKYGFQNYSELQDFASSLNHKVVSVEYIGKQDVYNGTVDNYHNFFVGGWKEFTKTNRRKYLYINNLQCGELPLGHGDACRLFCINLAAYVNNPYTDKASYDYDKLYKDAQIAQRFIDNIVDLEEEAIKKIIAKIESDPEPLFVKQNILNLWKTILDKCVGGRRTGTGITALGDSLAMLGIKYGSEESLDIVEKIYQALKLGCYQSSVEMAEEIGPFRDWDWEKEKDNPFLNRLKLDKTSYCDGEKLFNKMSQVGRRNINLLTTAPTGTISTQACIAINQIRYHNTTSGIEPLFMISFTRRKKGNPSDLDFRTDFVDQNGDSWMEFKIYHEPINGWADLNRDKNKDDNPYVGSCAQEIDWKNRVILQGLANKHIDNSISSTLNLPEDVSLDEVREIYNAAWKNNLKGVTIYRDNCRTGVLVDSTKLNKNSINKTKAPKRPKSLPCEVYHINIKGVPYFILIGILDNDPYEVFAGKNKNGKFIIPTTVKSGVITKKSRGKYHAIFDDGTELMPITAFCENEEEALTRLISAALRHGADISFLVHQLEKTDGDMQSFSKSIARALKKKIKNGTKVFGEECPSCSNELIRQEGCLMCNNCGYSKCG
ncbi:MAG: HNH endonuclease [Rickettsiaceae bacterium]|nr:HNH endonuclease [Rickettsiaceae bacterium]